MIRLTDFSDRAVRKLRKFRKRHGFDPDESPIGKPVGMHWKTFRRFAEKEGCLSQIIEDHIAWEMAGSSWQAMNDRESG
ncbi:MAG: hypothetical protein DRQ37_01815 [Gammaproteobacteria bacterium]|nr:MAG: hypothetical protein DRQ37_01815 [Gammaproteobacteria bacterium]